MGEIAAARPLRLSAAGDWAILAPNDAGVEGLQVAAKDRERISAIDEALRRLSLVVDGVRLGLVVNEDGLTIAAYPGAAVDAAVAGAVAARLADLARRGLERLGQGEIGRVLVEGERGIMLCCPAGDVILALLIAKEASLAHTLFAAQKAADEIAASLQREKTYT